MSTPLQPPVQPASVVKTEPQTIIKNEPPESECMDIDIPDLLGEEISPDKKDVFFLAQIICAGSITTETVAVESKHSEAVETQVIVETENLPFVKIENITPSTNLDKTSSGYVSEGIDQGVIEVQALNEHLYALGKLETNEQLGNFSDDLNGISVSSKTSEHLDFAESHGTCEIISSEEDKEEIKVIKAPVIPVEPHEYTSLAQDKHVSHVCNHCPYTCKKLNDLKNHITKQHREVTTMYQCPNCPLKSKWKSSLQHHIIRKHKDAKDIQWFKCNLCEMKFKLKSLLVKHRVVHLTDEQMQVRLEVCPICGKGFVTKSLAKRHIRFVYNKEPSKRIKCQHCEYTTLVKQRLRHHVKTHHMDFEERQRDYETECLLKNDMEKYEERYRCDRCSYTNFSSYLLNKHKLIHLKPEEIRYFYCYHCSYKAKRRDDLIIHISRHVKNENIPFNCYICDFMTFKRNLIVEHLKRHKKFKPYELFRETETEIDDRVLMYCCNECNYKTPTRHCMKIHKVIHLKPEEIEYFYCHHCSYKSKRRNDLRHHISHHFRNEEVPFPCYICNFITLKRHLIIEHIKTHGKFTPPEHPHETEIVDLSSKYRCDKCHYKTYKLENFKKHKLIHLKPEEIQYFYCYHCSYKAKRRDNLRAHVYRHFKKENVPFHCYICDFMTLKRLLIVEHIKTHSKVQIKTEIKEES